MNSSGRRSITSKIAGGALALGLLFGGARAADAPPAAAKPAAAAPQGDPFIKKDAPPPTPVGPVSNVIFTVETYEVGLAAASKLLQASDANEARFDQVLDLQKAGKARLAMVLCAACTSGEQGSVVQCTQMPFATNFDTKGKTAKPTDYKRENLGYRFVYKGQTLPDGKSFDAVLFYSRLRFAGFRDEAVANGTISQPQFAAARLDLKTLLPFGQMQLLGTPSFEPKVAGSDSQTTLAFGKIDLVPIDSGQPATNRAAAVANEFSAYSMEPEQAAQVLDPKQGADSAYQAVQALVKSGEAKLEHLSVLTTNTGLKAGIDEVTEVSYPTVFGGTEFVTQDVGFRAETTPQYIGNSSALTLKDIFNNWTRLEGYLRGQTLTPDKGDLPVFGISEIATSINVALDEHELLGTLTPPSDSGLDEPKSDGRIWLEFVRTTAVNP